MRIPSGVQVQAALTHRPNPSVNGMSCAKAPPLTSNVRPYEEGTFYLQSESAEKPYGRTSVLDVEGWRSQFRWYKPRCRESGDSGGVGMGKGTNLTNRVMP